MVPSTRSSTTDVYIVVLDPMRDYVRALLFDSQGRQMEGFSARLPMRKDASIDCLDQMHRLVADAGFRVGAIVGRAESEVTAEDRAYWKSFESAKWFAPLDHNGAILVGSGCLDRSRFGFVFGDSSFLGAIVDQPVEADGLACQKIDEKRWLVSSAVEEAHDAYARLRKAVKGSIDQYFEKSAAEDPLLAPIDAAMQRFRGIFEKLSRTVGKPDKIVATGAPLLQSPALCRRIAAVLGEALTLSTEVEPAARGSAVWALEKIGAVADLRTLEASTGSIIDTVKLETTQQ